MNSKQGNPFVPYAILIVLVAALAVAVVLVGSRRQEQANSPVSGQRSDPDGVGFLYEKAEDLRRGRHRCVVTVVERNGDSYKLVTVASCVASFDANTGLTVIRTDKWLVSFDEKNAFEAKVSAVGDLKLGENFAVLEINTTAALPVYHPADTRR